MMLKLFSGFDWQTFTAKTDYWESRTLGFSLRSRNLLEYQDAEPAVSDSALSAEAEALETSPVAQKRETSAG
jgi:hypothetical protein